MTLVQLMWPSVWLLCVMSLTLVTYSEPLPMSCDCPPWQFCHNDSTCLDCNRCDSGGEGAIELCSNYTDTQCGGCEEGKTYSVLSVSENVYRCQPCTICEPDRQRLSACTQEANTYCGPCPSGMFAYINDSCLTCSPCPDDTSVVRFTECRFNGAPEGFMCAPGACPGCSDHPTTPTVNPSDKGGFIPANTAKLVVMDSTQQPNNAVLAGVAITVANIAGILTIVVLIFSVWLLYTLYVKDYMQRRRRRAQRARQLNDEETTILVLAEEAPEQTTADGEMAMPRRAYRFTTVQIAEPSFKLLHVIGMTTEVTDKWKPVAGALGISSDVIDEIDRSHCDALKCCECMLEKWLKSADNSWDFIIRACEKNEFHSIAKKTQIFFNGDEIFYDSDVASWDYLVSQIKRVYLAWSIMPKWCSRFSDALLPLNVIAQNCTLPLEDAVYKLTKEISSEVFVLVGVAGAGKTTMVRQLLHNWARRGSSSHYAFVLYTNMIVDKNEVTDLQSLIRLHMERSPDSHMMEKMEEILIKQQGEGVLVILDEYDETVCDSTQNSFISLLLTKELLPKCSMLLVCRPDTVPKKLSKVELLEIPALNDEQVNYYLQETAGPIHATTTTIPLRPLVHNPLLLNILCYLIKCYIDVTGINSLTELCGIFVLKILSNQVKKDENHSTIVRSLLYLMADASYEELHYKIQALSDLSDVDILIESGLVERHSKTATPYFVHLTIQEYLAAYHIAHSQSPPESLLENINCKSFILAFLSGLTGKVFSTLIQNSLSVASICYVEAKWAQSKHQIMMAEEPAPMRDVLILDKLTITPYHVQCVNIFLKEVKVNEIDISWYNDKLLNSCHALLPKSSEFVDSIMSYKYLTNLSAEHINLSIMAWIDFANMLKSNKSLLELNISHNDIGDHKIVDVISEALTINTCLQTLLLKFCNLIKSHAERIIKSLLSNKTLQHLDLSNNLIKDLNITIVKDILQLGVVQVIGLGGNPIEREVHSGLIEVANSVQRDGKMLFLFHNISSCTDTFMSYETFV